MILRCSLITHWTRNLVDVLFRPTILQDIGAKYPTWLEDHRDSLSSEDLQRFEEQYGYIQDIVDLYERDPSNYTRLLELLQEASGTIVLSVFGSLRSFFCSCMNFYMSGL